MTKILAIDTSTDACSVALGIGDTVDERFLRLPKQHASHVLPMIERLLHEKGLQVTDLDAVAFGCGPGSFTGLRIASGVAQGLAFAASLPVIPVSTLVALAWQAARVSGERFIISCLDARMNEVYWGCYEIGEGEVRVLTEEQVSSPQAVTADCLGKSRRAYAAGTGWVYQQAMNPLLRECLTGVDQEMLPRAGDIALLAAKLHQQGHSVAAEYAAPVYLRNNVVQVRD